MASRYFFARTIPGLFARPVALGSGLGLLGATTLVGRSYSRVLNDVVAGVATAPDSRLNLPHQHETVPRLRPSPRFNYRYLTLGSMTGAAAGFIVGKFSKLLVALVVVGALTLQYLSSRGIYVPGLGYAKQSAVDWGRRQSVREIILLEDAGFKASFLAAFSVAALYA
ncbi:hypothetical protein DV451_003118 [Geotrichum candidum]|uniref:FUN14 domain-containing protein n=1 Tax=Geotrichum candidum TaxID=1173061 RepID=A0A0J9XJL7_GEOCN|nr:hypothetical protein DV451_003118 [Geotrichum candidum]KAI9212174.1 hypothetical protein DS838_002967 [Geotrichum bryndzae]KAF5113699.1 hypothetical protein DV454_003410 [Geotrichum candidum]KAF5118411.1 hypothetical protein DV452_002047 [Geotrichum candidum]KAF5129089.1 hypothetical protein DV495_002598 [Geotrichum candidum]